VGCLLLSRAPLKVRLQQVRQNAVEVTMTL
jgi:hypothetical protein